MIRIIAFITLLSCMYYTASAGEWTVNSLNFATIAAAVSCPSVDNCIAPIADNGQGSFILETSDGGKTWQQLGAPETLGFLGGAAQGDYAVCTDFLSAYYSSSLVNSKYNFTDSLISGGITSQNVEAFGGTYFGAAGDNLLGGNGVAVSADGGAIFDFINITVARTDTRYGAYPTLKTWYISAGAWPSNQKKNYIDENGAFVRQLTRRLHVVLQQDGSYAVRHIPAERQAVPNDNNNGWNAQILKTTDGGKTWESVFWDEGNFYFNQISCFTETNCVAVGEADSSNQPGIRFYMTTDGFKTVTRTYFNPSSTLSVLAVDMVSETEVWAAGGNLDTDFLGYFWHSLDGGKTWSNQTVAGVYGNAMSFPNSSRGYATAFNFESNSAFLTYQ